ncbi:hypothetical protein ACFYXM_11235 [Streptomyces sp. NPDC002476]|uniref:hypothetical protein n=1 Tax=Streptomyces sp. NPDC002476 TaxID=3364648 RepID=UPI003696F29D
MSASSEGVALERIRAAGYRALEEYPGKVSLPWLLECLECGEPRRRRPDPRLTPCSHAKHAKREAEWEKLRRTVSTYTLSEKNLRAIEDIPEPGEPWWVQCKFCGRVWHMPEDRLRACPHKGDGDPGHPPLPEPAKKRTVKASTAPPSADEMTVLPGLVGRHAYLIEDNGRWSLRVSRYAQAPELDSWTLLLHVPLDEPSTEAAEKHLREAGWTITPHRERGWGETRQVRWSEPPQKKWPAGQASLYAEVTSPLLTEYAVGRDVLGSQARKPEITARNFLKRTRTEAAGTGRDAQGRTWDLYLRTEVEAARRMEQEA